MQRPERHTSYRWEWVWGGAFLLVVGAALLALALSRADAWALVVGDLLLGTFGWGAPLEALVAAGYLAFFEEIAEAARVAGATAKPAVQIWLYAGPGLALWVAGWAALAFGIRRSDSESEPPSEAVGSKLYPRLQGYRDFYWSTLAAYGGGILLAELAVIFLHTLLVGADNEPVGNLVSGERGLGVPPLVAFSFALAVGSAIAFAGGFIGATRARRLSAPESTIALIYFGLPVPIILSLMRQVPQLMVSLGYRLREVTYLAGLLGQDRPELGYWLVLAGLVLMLYLGVTTGFVATSSGRLDIAAGFELFVARRHVSVFRPGLLLGAFAVLIFGIIPPLVVWAVLHAAAAAVERTRIRALGKADPLQGAKALHQLKLKAQSPTAMMTALSVGGVGVGVMALIIVLSVMSGFEIDLQQKILGTNAHAVVLKYGESMGEYEQVMEKIKGVKGVVGQTPFILNEVMISSEGNISGALIKGIDPETVGDVTDLPKYMLPGGSLEGLVDPEKIIPKRIAPKGGAAIDDRPAAAELARPAGSQGIIRTPEAEEDDFIIAPEGGSEAPLPGIVLGRELAAQLKVVVGDRLNVVSPLGGELGPQGPMPKSRPFRVAGIFYSGMFEYDSKFVYIALTEAQRFFGVKGATGIELKVADIDDARRITRAVYDRLEGYPYRTKDWGEMNRNLFSALRLEKLVMAIILSIIVIVAAGLIVATVIMLVLEKRKEISVLKALGVPDGGIVKIFLAEGLQIGVAGGVLGLAAGLAWCLFIEKVGIKLDPEVYYIPALPVRIEPLQTALSVVIAVLVTFLASIYPALKASQVEPVEGLKAE
ncbi:MAG: ABC transporter permease [Myxococcales bacterium]|nr:ABC transporter permease [Myxococcales bacterium]